MIFIQIICSFGTVLEMCDTNMIVISPEMKEGLLKINSLIISLYEANDDVVVQLTPMSSITKNKLSPIAIMRIVIHKRYAQ